MGDNALGDFLRARRQQVRPEAVGLPDNGRRQVPGLRREELALLSGVSLSYYVRLEQGHDRNPSPSVLDALARILQLDADAAQHLQILGASSAAAPQVEAPPESVRPELARMLDHQVGAPAFVLGRRLDVLAANRLARALHPSFHPGRNIVRDVFLDPAAQQSYPDVEHVQRNAVGSLRAAAGALPDDRRLTEIVGELSVKSEGFRRLWSRHEVRTKIAGRKRFDHPKVGELTLDYESLTISGGDGQQLIVYHADPGGSEAETLALLHVLAAGRAPAQAGPSRQSVPRT